MLLGNPSEPASCQVKLLDFGLARLLTEADGVTLSEGNVAGTPAYMSPENITLQLSDGDFGLVKGWGLFWD